jgi:hypothetical protein
MSSPARKTLFLGLDGVMHHSRAKVAGFLSCMPVLEQALGTADVDIVVLSTWDFANDFSRLKAAFPLSLRARVVGRTTEDLGSLHKRFREIQNWLGPVPVLDWRVLDSDHLDYPEACPELIRCSPHLGMGPVQAQALKLWVQTPAPLPPKLPPSADGAPARSAPPTPSAPSDPAA